MSAHKAGQELCWSQIYGSGGSHFGSPDMGRPATGRPTESLHNREGGCGGEPPAVSAVERFWGAAAICLSYRPIRLDPLGERVPLQSLLGPRRFAGPHPMNLSVKGEYALQAIFDLAAHPSGEPIKIAEIARRQHIP